MAERQSGPPPPPEETTDEDAFAFPPLPGYEDDEEEDNTAEEEQSRQASPPREPTQQTSSLAFKPCRSVDLFEKLNRIEEGSYGIVYRARERATGEIVALKKLKLEKETNGFPVTSLREIDTLLRSRHPHVVNVREIVIGESALSIFMVMDFVEHDLKTLLGNMKQPFLQSEVKTLMLQLCSAVDFLHDHWIIHRDLKTSNLLLNNRGELKVADFGLARNYGSPMPAMTPLVVTLWYRAPELLLGAKEYTTAIDMWSIGCIFGEMVTREPLLPGQGEVDQINKIFKLLGTPSAKIWPDYPSLPHVKTFSFAMNQPYNYLSPTFAGRLTEAGIKLMGRCLTYDPANRITAAAALNMKWFTEHPPPKKSDFFPTFPSAGSGEKVKMPSPSAPHAQEITDEDEAFKAKYATNDGFRLRA